MYSRISKILWGLFITGVVFLVCYTMAVRDNWFNLAGGFPDLSALENPQSQLASIVYTADGEVLGKYFMENRNPVEYDGISPNLVNALKATEDIRFEKHSGIDLRSIGRAVFGVLTFNPKGGGSTISQQFAKIQFNTRGNLETGKLNDIPVLGKLIAKTKEWMLAIEIEKSYTKEEIMSMYLNQFEFGSNAFGIKVASKTFFGTTPDSLKVEQAAILVGLLKNPSYYNPKRFPDHALRRRNTVMSQMVKYGFLDKAAYDTLKEKPVDIADYKVESHYTGSATYFRAELAKELKKWCKTHTKPNGENYNLYTDGLKIYTTIDSRMQKYAEEAVLENMRNQQELFFEHWKGRNPWITEENGEIKGFLQTRIKWTERYRVLKLKYGGNKDSIDRVLNTPRKMKVFTWDSPTFEKDTTLSPMDSLKYYKHFLHSGMMSMDPHTGYIKAWVGGINFKYFQYDHVKQGFRQPGSTFKPIIYSAAVAERSMHPCFPVLDAPMSIDLPDGETWTPANSSEYSYNTFTLRQAMAMSKNTAAVYLMRELGPDIVGKYAEENFGIKFLRDKYGKKERIERVPSLCLGTSDVSVFEMVAAYTVFPNQGVWTEPIYITKIEDKEGKVLETFVPHTIEALKEEEAYTMTYMLRGSNEETGGTSIGLRTRAIYEDRQGYDFIRGREVGGKTGTTSNYSDAWFIGITKNLVTGIWSGGEETSIHFRSLKYGQGGRQAMPAFAKYMEKVYADDELPYYLEKDENGEFIKPNKPMPEFDCWKYEQAQLVNKTDSTNRKGVISSDDDFF